jgi:hypothetical protein
MMNYKRCSVAIVCSVFLLAISLNVLAGNDRFPKPNSPCFNFKPNEVASLDSLLNAYVLTPKFEQEINQFVKDDSLNGRKQFNVVFTGSSSFRRWYTLTKDFSPTPTVNRGFGGSKVLDLVYYADTYLYKLKPRFMFVYVENDLPMNSSKSIILLFKYLEQVYHNKLPDTKIVFCSVKKSISRRAHWTKIDALNNYLSANLTKNINCGYLELNKVLFDESGKPKGQYYVSDSLHLNEKGYEQWLTVMKPRLENEYNLLQIK